MEDKRFHVAVCSYQGRVCPRFDLTQEIVIYDRRQIKRGPLERLSVFFLSPEEVFHLLVSEKIRTLIVGGIQSRFEAMLFHHDIEVIWGIIGTVEDVIEAYDRKRLRIGMGKVEGPPKRGDRAGR